MTEAHRVRVQPVSSSGWWGPGTTETSPQTAVPHREASYQLTRSNTDAAVSSDRDALIHEELYRLELWEM